MDSASGIEHPALLSSQTMQNVSSQPMLVGAGGFVGAGLRYLVSGWVYQLVPNAVFLWGTLVVNVVGCLMLGLFGGLAEIRAVLSAATIEKAHVRFYRDGKMEKS
jgi:fluoride ion exporter CrcB/FEX